MLSNWCRLRASKSEPSPGSLLLAVCAKGLRVCPENNPPSIFLWSSISKLSFERKKFEIRTSHEKLTLYTTSDEKSRLLLALCKATHQFSMAVAPRLSEARKEEEERQRWGCDQRVSVISSTSSNTTSGIVSDRVSSINYAKIRVFICWHKSAGTFRRWIGNHDYEPAGTEYRKSGTSSPAGQCTS